MKAAAQLLAILTSLLVVIYSQPTGNYTLGVNLVANPSFQTPTLPVGQRLYDYYYSIASWKCKYICQLINMPLQCIVFPLTCKINSNQMLDLDSEGYNEIVSQTITVSVLGWYMLSFEWIPPVLVGIGRFFQIYVGSTLLDKITINSSNYVTEYAYNYRKIINVTANSNVLSFKMGGTLTGYGIMIDNVAFQQVTYIQSTTNTTTNGTTNTTNNTIITPSNISISTNATNNTSNSTNNTNNTSNTTTNASNLTNTTNTTANSTNSTTNNSTDSSNTTSGNSTNTNNSSSASISNNSAIIEQQQDGLFKLIHFMMFNNFSATLNSIPGSRVFFSVILNFYNSFDRLQLYFFHHQNLTTNSYKFISMINTLQNLKGCLLQQIVQQSSIVPDSASQTISNVESQLSDMLNYKMNYSDPWIADKTQSGSFFYANNIDFLYYSIIGTLLFHVLFYFMFKLLFKYRISVYFRKYSFFAMIYFELLEGNNQQLTFYFFQERKALFFFNFSQKIQTTALVCFYFLLFMFSVAGILFLYFWYKKHFKYFIESHKKEMVSVSFAAFECGVIPMSFGMVHSLLLQDLWAQTLALLSLELIFIAIKIYYLGHTIFELKLPIFIKILTAFARIGFIITFYCYQMYNYHHLINSIHYGLILFYLICWILELLIEITNCLIQFLRMIGKLIMKSTKNNQEIKSSTLKQKSNKVQIQCFDDKNQQIQCIISGKYYKTYLKVVKNTSQPRKSGITPSNVLKKAGSLNKKLKKTGRLQNKLEVVFNQDNSNLQLQNRKYLHSPLKKSLS